MLKKLVDAGCLFVVALLPLGAHADGVQTGVIGPLSLSAAASNYNFRIVLKTPENMCNSANTMAYLNITDVNYAAFAAILTNAKLTGEAVQVFSHTDSDGQCHIYYVTLA